MTELVGASPTRKAFYWLAAILLWVFVLVLWSEMVADYSRVITDFIQDYAAGLALSRGEPIYGTNINQIALDVGGFEGIDNYHPPFTALLYLPLAGLSYLSAFYVWSVIALVAYLLVVRWALQLYPLPIPGVLLTPLLLLWYPFLYAVGTGNISSLLIVVIVAAWRQERRGRDLLGGALFGLACLIKLFPGLYLFYLWYRRKWSAIVAMLTVVFAGNVLMGILIGWGELFSFFFEVATRDMSIWGEYILNASLYGICIPIMHGTYAVAPLVENGMQPGGFDSHVVARAMFYLLSVLLLLISCFVASKASIKGEESDIQLFGLFSSLMLMLSPITWMHVFGVLLLPLFYLLQQGRGGERVWMGVPLIVLLLFALPDVDIASWLAVHYAPAPLPSTTYLATRFSFWGLLIVWLAFIRDIQLSLRLSEGGEVSPGLTLK